MLLIVCSHSNQYTPHVIKLVNQTTTELALSDAWLEVDGALPPKDILGIIIGMVRNPGDWIASTGFSYNAYFRDSDSARVVLTNSWTYAHLSFAIGGFAFEDGCRYEVDLAVKVKRYRVRVGLLELRHCSYHEHDHKREDGVVVFEDFAKKGSFPCSRAHTVSVAQGGASVKLVIDFTHDQDRECARPSSSSGGAQLGSSSGAGAGARGQAFFEQPKDARTRAAHFEVTYDDGDTEEHSSCLHVRPPCVLLVANAVGGGVMSARVNSVKIFKPE